MAITDAEQIGEGPCICGRIARKPHCPECGSYDVYARGRRNDVVKIDPIDGSKRRVTTFKCNKCGVYYDRDQWRTACTAPQYITREMRRRQKEEMEKWHPDTRPPALQRQMLEALNKVMSKRGIQPTIAIPPRASDSMFREDEDKKEPTQDEKDAQYFKELGEKDDESK